MQGSEHAKPSEKRNSQRLADHPGGGIGLLGLHRRQIRQHGAGIIGETMVCDADEENRERGD